MTLETFPRLRASEPSNSVEGRGLQAREGEAVCQFYPELQAETVCEECGCFLSRKASVEWSGRTLCLPCLHNLREQKGADAFSSRRSLPDNVGIALVVFLLPLTLFTGPYAIFYLLRHRKTPGSLVPRSRFRWWLALVLAILATTGWLVLFVIWIAMFFRAVTGS